jgi:hypothetical protein
MVVSALTGGGADAAPLPRGADTKVAYLAGRVVHAGSATYTLPDQSQGGEYRVDYRLVGLDVRGRWLVGVAMHKAVPVEEFDYNTGARARLFALRPSGATMLYDELNNGGEDPYFRLGRNRGRVLLTYHLTDHDSYAQTDLRVLDLNGHTVARYPSRSYDLTPLDVNGRKVVLGGYGLPARLWTLGGAVRRLSKPKARGIFADLAHNALAVRSTNRRWAMTSITHPSRIRWRGYFAPMRISPDGKRVVGWSVSKKTGWPLPVVHVRRMSDGRLLRAYSRSGIDTFDTTLAWESNGALVFQASADGTGGGADVLVRCALFGGCTRASDSFSQGGDPISFAFEPDTHTFGAFRYP